MKVKSVFGISRLPVTTISSVLEPPKPIKVYRPYLGKTYINDRHFSSIVNVNMREAYRKFLSACSKRI